MSTSIQAYLHKYSYYVGDTLDLRINTASDNIILSLISFPDMQSLYTHFINNINLTQKETPKNSAPFADGYQWKINFHFKIHTYLNSGLYFIQLHNHCNFFYLPIIILSNKPTDFLVLMNTNTWCAYNTQGGGSFYRYNLPYNTKYGTHCSDKYPIRPFEGSGYFPTVTYDRPLSNISDEIAFFVNHGISHRKSHLFFAELILLKWLSEYNFNFSLITDQDLHEKFPISKYKTLVLNCHPEYWSKSMLENVKLNANNIISLAGNVAFRKITVERNTLKRIGYWKTLDLLTITGSCYTITGFEEWKPYKILKSHSLFTGITNSTFGYSSYTADPTQKDQGISGYETDKRLIGLNTQIIAKGLNSNQGGGDILCFRIKSGPKKRFILSVGSTGFTGGLFLEEDVDTFVSNVFNFFHSI